MEFSPALLLYAVLQFIAFLFVLVGTPIDMLRQRNGGSRFGNTPCVTLWGYKVQCYNSTYEASVDRLWMSCRRRRNAFRAAQAFAVISIFVYGLAAAFGFIALWCCSRLRWVCLALNISGVITLCVVWATIVVTYYKADDLCDSENLISFFGSGFVLLVMAWCLDIINIVFLLLSRPAMHASDNADTKE
ncbi:putative Amastin surface glycoprotein [Leishmania naiffi]|uniref:Amastin surface glycoprotein n=1 Tax=Leishmania naiffi TaxID=5678 RepID=A0AAW3CBE9_9TRYP